MTDYIEVDGLRVGPCMWRSKVEEVEQLRARVAELEAYHHAHSDKQAVSVPQQWRDTMEEIEERVAELESDEQEIVGDNNV